MRQPNCVLSYYIGVLNIKFRSSHPVKERAINIRIPHILKKYEPFKNRDISKFFSAEEALKRYIWNLFKNGNL